MPTKIDKLKRDHSCGVVPVRVFHGKRYYLVVQHKAGHWGFPKGHPENDETPAETALRELAEETGLTDCGLIEKPAFREEYVFTKRSGKTVLKDVVYFIGLCSDQEAAPAEDEISDLFWGDAERTREKLTFDEGRALLQQVEDFLDLQAV
ncbi:MAG: bis(5'-nucleosyl)-tetraphosphatase [Phycisphaeraceae bacterium]